ncbi:Nn.00g047880.m01.CDS01 [Neocucurbitaria sp. VM-36]
MVPKWKDMGDRIREDILFRLRWNVLATLDSIEIATRHHNEVVFVPFFGNPSAQESIAQPPLNRVEVNIGEFLNKRSLDYGEEEDRYKPPAALIIENVDGSPITVGHYVTQAHAYLNEHIEEIKKVKGELYGKVEKRDDGTTVRSITYGQPYLPPDTKIFFKRGEVNISSDEFWPIQLRQAHRHEKRRGQEPTIGSTIPLPAPQEYLRLAQNEINFS